MFAHSLDYGHSFSRSLIHHCSFPHFLVVDVNIFCCVKSCPGADPADTARRIMELMWIWRHYPGHSGVKWDLGLRRESSHRAGGINWISISGAGLMGFSVSRCSDDEDHLDGADGMVRWNTIAVSKDANTNDKNNLPFKRYNYLIVLFGPRLRLYIPLQKDNFCHSEEETALLQDDEMCLSLKIWNHSTLSLGLHTCVEELITQSSHQSSHQDQSDMLMKSHIKHNQYHAL